MPSIKLVIFDIAGTIVEDRGEVLEAFGAVPSNFTVPLIVAAVAGSIGVAGPDAAGCSAIGLEAGDSSFLLQAASTSSAHNASTPIVTLAHPGFLFMMSPFL